MVSEYVGLVKGKVHDKRIISEYYCSGCGYPVTDHDSYCSECGGKLHERMGINNKTHKTDDITFSGMYVSGLPIEDVRVFGMTLDEIRQMMKRDAERELHMFGRPVERGTGIPKRCPNCGAKIIK